MELTGLQTLGNLYDLEFLLLAYKLTCLCCRAFVSSTAIRCWCHLVLNVIFSIEILSHHFLF